MKRQKCTCNFFQYLYYHLFPLCYNKTIMITQNDEAVNFLLCNTMTLSGKKMTPTTYDFLVHVPEPV